MITAREAHDTATYKSIATLLDLCNDKVNAAAGYGSFSVVVNYGNWECDAAVDAAKEELKELDYTVGTIDDESFEIQW